MGFDALLATVRARWPLIVFSGVLASIVALAVGLALPREYRSDARVQVDSLQQNALTGLFEPRVRIGEFLGQQAAIASSRAVALDVYDEAVAGGYFLESDFLEHWREATGGELVAGTDPRLWAADQLLRGLEISADAIESTLTFIYRDEDPAQAARLANMFANAYMDAVLVKRQRRSARRARSFSDETRALETEIDAAQADLTEFRQRSGIVGLGTNSYEDVEVELATLTLRLAEAKTDYSEAMSLLRQARAAEGPQALLTLPLPEHMQSGRQAQSRLGSMDLTVRRLAERYNDAYPSLAEARAERDALLQTIVAAVEDHAALTRRNVETLQAAVAEKKAEVVALQSTKQTYDVLSKKVEASRDTYDLVANRSLQEALQSRVDIVDVFMLARAVPARSPSAPPLPVIALIGAFAGLTIGAAAAVTIEIIEGRVRSARAVKQVLRAPLLGQIDRLGPMKRFRRRAAL